jgi:DNA repair exonuclease SbcCD nuclease subunit
MTILLHTADWHIGKGFHRFAERPDIQHRLQRARMEAVERVGDCAREVGAAAVLVAGDVFHTSDVPDSVVVELLDRIGGIGLPVVAIPGNHDHAGEGTVWRRESFRRYRESRAPNLQVVLDEATCIEVEDVDVVAVPVRQRMHQVVLADLGQVQGRSGVARVGLVHGATDSFSEDGESRAIQWVGEAGARLDYLALGDYHRQQQVERRHCPAWYSGTIEPDSFLSHGQAGERRGAAIRVEVHGPGRVDVKPLTLDGGMRWVRLAHSVQDDAALRHLEREVQELAAGAAQSTVCQIDLRDSRLGYAAAARLDALLELERPVFCALERRGEVALVPDEEELQVLCGLPGVAGAAARRLHAQVDLPTEDGAVAREALQRLYSLMIGDGR